VLTCFSLVFLIARTAEFRKEFRLLAAASIAVTLWSISDISAYILPSPEIAGMLSHVSPCIYFIIPVMFQLGLSLPGTGKSRVALWGAYLLAGVATLAAWTGYLPLADLFGSALSLAGAGCIIAWFTPPVSQALGKSARSSELIFQTGMVVILILLSLQPLLKDLFPPLSLSFVPLIMISWGLVELAEKDVKGGPAKQGLIHALVIALAAVPLLGDMIFLALNARFLFGSEPSPWVFHRSVVIAFSLFITVVCAFLSITKAEKRTETLLFSVLSLFACCAGLRELVVMGLPESLSGQIILVNDIFLVNIIGICAHLVLKLCRKADWWKVSRSYALGLLIVPVMLYESFLGRSMFAYDPVRFGGLGHFLFIAAFGAVLILSGVMLWAEAKFEKDLLRKRGILSILAGIGIMLAILGGMAAAPAYPFYDLAFVALLLLGYGIFLNDLRRINAYARRQAISGLLRLLLTTVYLTLGILVVWLLKDYPWQFIVDRIDPYAIPPLISFLVAASLSLFVLGMEKNRPEGQLFSLIGFCYAMLNLDIFLIAIVQDPKIALFISRVDHFFLATLLLGVNLHLAYLVIGKKDSWWVVYASYLIGFVMAPLSQTDWYFQGMYRYYWGFFAHKAILYDIMSTLWGAGLVYAIYLLHKASAGAEIHQKKTIRRVLTAFVLLALLSMGNNPAIYGYEVYPFGTFIFPALFYLAYGLFKFNLKTALQDIRGILFWIGLTALTVFTGFIPVFLLPGLGMNTRIFLGLALVAVVFHPLKKGWNVVMDLFIRESSDYMKESYYGLTDSLSRIHHREKIHQMLCSWFFEALEGSSFVSLFSLNDLSGQRIYFGWKTWNGRNDMGLFGERDLAVRENLQLSLRKDHPLIEICSLEPSICTKDTLLKMSPSMHAFDGSDGLLRDAEIVMPIFSKGVMLAVMLIGKKGDGAPYTLAEFDTMHNISLVLGPQIENAVLLEGLEEKVIQRTRELNNALSESQQKEREIRENSDIITRQNQIFRTLLETSTRIHQLESLDELFTFILSQLHNLFKDFQGGIILENKRRGILEATSFIGVSVDEQRVILAMRAEIGTPDFGDILNGAFIREGIPTSAGDVWNVIPMEAPSSRISGYMIIKGQTIDRQTREIFTVFLGQLSAVTQNRILMIQLERMASTDGMTGLYNRAFLNQELRKAIQHAKRFTNIFFSIMVVDVNGLKKLNDTYGHEKGDEAIIKVASQLKALCRNTDIVCRLGGDEFAILMPSTSYSQAEILFKRVVEGAESLKVVVSGSGDHLVTLPVHISVGLASSDDTLPEDVMKKADTLMYEAKEMYYASKAASRG
jgi:diguanylate cyclase (GGDEF)-like protein